MTTYAEHLLNLKKLKDDPSIDNSIFICPSLINVPKNNYENNGDVYMTNKKALYGVGQFVKSDVKNKEESLITLNDLDNLPEESNKVDIEITPNGSVDTNYVDNNDGTYTAKCSSSTTYTIKHNDIPVKSCYITCVSISTIHGGTADSWGKGYNYDNHEVSTGSITTGYITGGNVYVATKITKNTNNNYTLHTSIKQKPWGSTFIKLSDTNIYITVYFTVDKGDGDETELNTQQTNLMHSVSPDATANDVEYDGKLKFSYKFNTEKNIFTGSNIEISYPK